MRHAVQAYAEMQPELREATEGFVALVTTLLDDAGINYLSVTGRAKSVASFAAKADRSVDGRPLYADPLERDHRPDRGPGDHLPAQRRRRGGRPAQRPAGRPRRPRHGAGDRPRGPVRLRQPAPARRPRPGPEHPAGVRALRERPAQVQVRTVLQHAWAEFEHAIRYKGTIPEEHVPDLDRRFTLAAGLLELADREFSLIRDRLQATVPEQHPEADVTDPRISAQDLGDLPGRPVRRRGLVAHRPLRLGLRAAARAGDHLARRARRPADLGGQRGDQRADGLPLPARRGPPARRRAAGGLRRRGTSALHGNAHRVALLRARLDKLRTPAE